MRVAIVFVAFLAMAVPSLASGDPVETEARSYLWDCGSLSSAEQARACRSAEGDFVEAYHDALHGNYWQQKSVAELFHDVMLGGVPVVVFDRIQACAWMLVATTHLEEVHQADFDLLRAYCGHLSADDFRRSRARALHLIARIQAAP